MIEKLQKDMIDAMKNHEKEKLTVIRGIKAELKKKELDEKIEITDDTLISVVSHQIKSLNDSIKEFEKGARNDLVEKAKYEIDILKTYLPEALSESEVDKIIDDIFDDVKPVGMKDMGNLMNKAKAKLNGRYDMGEVSKKIRVKLQ